ncbi:hypothetical protein KR222_001342 [Zaprionus bogoriensis]|nr:hypothetical protein KR222_001342 [Zaprionus bogoriensis]
MLKVSLLLLSLVLVLSCNSCWAHRELLDLLEKQRVELDLSDAEVAALRPFYLELQKQHDYLYNLQLQNGDGSAQEQQNSLPVDPNYLQAFEQLRTQFSGNAIAKPSIVYDTTLPSLEELIPPSSGELSLQQQAELQDLRDIMQEVLDEAQLGIDELVRRASDMEINLLALNKPKIVLAAIGALETMWSYWGRGSQAAYCSYSHVPQLTEALHAINDGVGCYSYTMGLVLRIQDETVASVKEVKRCVRDLVSIYKRIMAKQSILGKILSGTLNLLSALRRVHDIIAVGIAGYDKVNNQLPGAAQQTVQCGTEFANSIPQMLETAQNLTTCIIYVDSEKPEYEFTKPEEERYWNTGEAPEEIPHENDVDEDDDDDLDDDLTDDYVDHR